MSNYNQMCLVSPKGKVHSTGGLSHPDWAHRNRSLTSFVGVKNLDYERCSGDEATLDENGSIALDVFLDEGWIRVRPGFGIELRYADKRNISTIKAIFRAMAVTSRGQVLYAEIADEPIRVSVNMIGRPDFSELDAAVSTDENETHRYRG